MKEKYIRAIFYGILSSLGFAPIYLFFTFFFSIDFFLGEILKFHNNRKKCFLFGWCFGFGYFLGNCYWLVSPLTFEFPKYIALIPFAITVAPAILGCYIGLIAVAMFSIISKYKINNNLIVAIIFSLLWGFMEIIRSYFFIAFPWNLIAYSWGFHRIMFQSVNIIGTFGLCFVVIFVYTMYFTLKREKKYYCVYCLILFFIFLFGSIRLFQEKKDNDKLNLAVRIIQPNFSQQEKQSMKNDEKQLKYIVDTINNSYKDNIDLFVFPESTIPHYITDDDLYPIINIKNSLINIKQKVLTGAVRYDFKNFYNSLLVFDGNKIINYYDKYYLAPFGEYIPYSQLLPNFITSFVGIGFTNGNVRAKIFENVFDGIKISPIICYQSLFPTAIDKKTDLIINITNDIWFGRTSAVYQHFTALKFRAVENNVPAIRSANSGISAYINRYGKVIKKTKLNRTEIVDIQL